MLIKNLMCCQASRLHQSAALNSLHAGLFSTIFLLSADFFFKINFLKNSFRDTIIVLNRLDSVFIKAIFESKSLSQFTVGWSDLDISIFCKFISPKVVSDDMICP